MKFIGVIPARYGSTRFPGKPLALINGKPMIQHVYEQVSKSSMLDAVYVATDHMKIQDVVLSFGGKVILTREDHETGSDRIEEVASKVEGDFFINIQGDEPLISHELIDSLIMTAQKTPGMVVTAKTKIHSEEDVANPNVVKVVTNRLGDALYFSRSPIPFNRAKIATDYYKHIGIYGYPKNVLHEFVKIPNSTLEGIEMLEQLRLLENGYKLKVVETDYDVVGVDTPEDIAKVEKILGGKQ